MDKKIKQLFGKACTTYQLLRDDDRILVAVSGGKDSLTLLHLLGYQAQIYKPHIEVEAIHVIMDNIRYETDHNYLQELCDQINVKLNIIHTSFQEDTDSQKSPCFLCSWNRRKAIFKYAEEHHFNKVAMGHHMDDFIITSLMNLSYEGHFSSMKPIMKMEHYPLDIIRPLCLVHEEMIKQLSEQLQFKKQKLNCPYENATQRKFMANIFRTMEEQNKEVRFNIWKAISSSFSEK